VVTDTRIIGYLRVSTVEQGDSRAGIDAQRAAIQREADHRGWTVVRYAQDVASGKTTNGRHALADAITSIEAGAASALVASKLDRVGRNTRDILNLAERAEKHGWALVVLDMGNGETLDSTTAMGTFVLTMLAAIATFERDRLSERTREALAQKRAQGVRLGRPVQLAERTRRRILRARQDGLSLAKIADGLNRDGVATAQGGARWWPTTISKVISSAIQERQIRLNHLHMRSAVRFEREDAAFRELRETRLRRASHALAAINALAPPGGA
jgi:DNA invertase Pin-like site-specific DNA recombinase